MASGRCSTCVATCEQGSDGAAPEFVYREKVPTYRRQQWLPLLRKRGAASAKGGRLARVERWRGLMNPSIPLGEPKHFPSSQGRATPLVAGV